MKHRKSTRKRSTPRYDRYLDPNYRGNPFKLPALIISVIAIVMIIAASTIFTVMPGKSEPVQELDLSSKAEPVQELDLSSESESVAELTTSSESEPVLELKPSEEAADSETDSATIEQHLRESADYTACFLALGAWEGYPGLDEIYWQVIADSGIDQSQVDAVGEVGLISDYFKANPDAMQSTVDQISAVLRE